MISVPPPQISEITPIPTPEPEPEPEPVARGEVLAFSHYEIDTDDDNATGLAIIGIKNTNITKLIIPSEVNGQKIICIDSGVFSQCKNLKYIYIPETIIQIYHNDGVFGESNYQDHVDFSPFDAMDNLEQIEVSIDNPVYYIAGNCLIEKDSISGDPTDDRIVCGWGDVDISQTPIKNIYSSELRNRTSVTSITLPNDINSIDPGAFSELPKLKYCKVIDQTEFTRYRVENNCLLGYDHGDDQNKIICGWGDVTIPSEISEINESAFIGCLTLNEIYTNNSITINQYAFAYSSITKIHLTNTVNTINRFAFHKVETLEDVVFEDDQESDHVRIPKVDGQKTNFLYNDNTLITCWGDAILPDEANVNSNAFATMLSLKSIVLPERITSIPSNCFMNSKITSLTLPSSITEINGDAFNGITSLKEIKVADGNTTYRAENNCLIEGDKVILTAGGDITIPSGIKTISLGAIPSNITSLTLNDELQELTTAIFQPGCKLSSLKLPASLTNLSGSALNVAGLENIEIDSANTKYSVKDNTIIADEEVVYAWGEYTIPETIGSYQYLYNYSSIISLIIPSKFNAADSLHGYQSFSNLSSLKEIKYEGTLEEFISACGDFQDSLINNYPNVLITFSNNQTYLMKEVSFLKDTLSK